MNLVSLKLRESLVCGIFFLPYKLMKDWDESNEQESEGKRLLRYEKRTKRVS